MEADTLTIIYETAIRQGNVREKQAAREDLEEAFRDDKAITEDQYKYLLNLYETFTRLGS